MSNLKLGVEVVSAHNFSPKNKEKSGSVFVEINFDGQKLQTTTKPNDQRPIWNETFFFPISDPAKLASLFLDVYLYIQSVENASPFIIGRVRLTGNSFSYNSEVLHYPLEKRELFFSRSRGELALRIFIDQPPILQLPKRPPFRKFRTIPSSPSTHEQAQPHDTPPVQRQAPLVQPQVPLLQPQAFPEPSPFFLKETRPVLGGGRDVGLSSTTTHDLVQQMKYLFVRIVKARDLPDTSLTGSLDRYVEVRVGNQRAKTNRFEKSNYPVWNEVFAFAYDRIQASVIEVIVMDNDALGLVRFDLNEVPKRAPPNSPLAPEWYRLVDDKGEKNKGEVMCAVWFGTQADESFPEAWHSDASDTHVSPLLRSKVYHSPRLWYLRVLIIEAQDLDLRKNGAEIVYVKVQLGKHVLRTRASRDRSISPIWNEELMFVAAEPFDDSLLFTLVEGAETIGEADLSLTQVHRRLDDRMVPDRWIHLGDRSSRLHLTVVLEGGYHVLDESTQYSSDLRPSAKPLWNPPVGVLELGILDASGLLPVKTRHGRGSSDTYCVAKYGQKWVRTRTIVDSLSPKYNEQYTWEVHDPATVLIVGVFDNGQTGGSTSRDMRIGKVRIRLSTLETGRVYTHSYPLLTLHPTGVKKTGELHLAIRVSCTSTVNFMYLYTRPLLPKMHYVRPLTVIQQDRLRYQAMSIVAARLGRAEPPLRKEVIEYMSDTHSHLFSMRRSKANFFRLMAVFAGLVSTAKLLQDVCMWRNTYVSVSAHFVLLFVVFYPGMILPAMFFCVFLVGVLRFFYRPRHPPHMDISLSHADAVDADELDEELDTFPTTRIPEVVRVRYDRLRILAGRVQAGVGDLATQGERLQALVGWRDPRATTIFIVFCLISAVVFYVTPFHVIALLAGGYFMRHPKLRRKTPSPVGSFFRRLPALSDSLL